MTLREELIDVLGFDDTQYVNYNGVNHSGRQILDNLEIFIFRYVEKKMPTKPEENKSL